jgi:hypothetical protein
MTLLFALGSKPSSADWARIVECKKTSSAAAVKIRRPAGLNRGGTMEFFVSGAFIFCFCFAKPVPLCEFERPPILSVANYVAVPPVTSTISKREWFS